MLIKYKTVINEGSAELTEKKSRFIATVRPVKTEEDAKGFIEEMKKKYWDATHNVYAYQIGEKNELARFSDDGEPQGTAGMPVLTVLQREDIKNTAVVVTRYFGGTLLGTGGLVRAYGHSAKEGLLAAGIVEVQLYCVFSIIVDYTLSGKVQYMLLQEGYTIADTVYTDKVEYRVLCEADREEAFRKAVTEAVNGKADIVSIEQKRGVWKDNNFTEVAF